MARNAARGKGQAPRRRVPHRLSDAVLHVGNWSGMALVDTDILAEDGFQEIQGSVPDAWTGGWRWNWELGRGRESRPCRRPAGAPLGRPKRVSGRRFTDDHRDRRFLGA